MGLDEKDFIEYQLFVKKFFHSYNHELQFGLKKSGYISKYDQSFVYLIGKQDKKIISLSNKCKKISYGNIMDFYELFPYETENRDMEESESKLEIILKKICKQELIDFAFDKELSLNICGQEKFELIEKDSIFIPMKAMIYSSTDEIIQKISNMIVPKRNITDKIKDFLKETSDNMSSVEPYFHFD